jgi:hypothetical protein
MIPKTRKILFISALTLGIIAALISVDYYHYQKPTIIECNIDPIAELPTVDNLLIRIRPVDYLSRLSADVQNFVEIDLWWDEHRTWGIIETPSAFLNSLNPLRELSIAQSQHVTGGGEYAFATAYEYEWHLRTADYPNNELRVPSHDGHIYTFNSIEVKVSREDGSYTEVIKNSKTSRHPRDELTVHGMCRKTQAPAKEPNKQVL